MHKCPSLFSKKCSSFIVDNDSERWGGHVSHCQPQSHLTNTRCIETFHKKVKNGKILPMFAHSNNLGECPLSDPTMMVVFCQNDGSFPCPCVVSQSVHSFCHTLKYFKFKQLPNLWKISVDGLKNLFGRHSFNPTTTEYEPHQQQPTTKMTAQNNN